MSQSVWIFLHSSALLFNLLSEEKKSTYINIVLPELIHILPCETCKVNYNNILKTCLKEIEIKNSYQLFDITVQIHNKINQKLNAPEYSTEIALSLYVHKKINLHINNEIYDLIHPIDDTIWECFIYSSRFFTTKKEPLFDSIIALFKTIINLFYLPSMDTYFIFSVLKSDITNLTHNFCHNVRALFYMHPYSRITLNYSNINLFNLKKSDYLNEFLDIDFVTVTKDDKKYIINNNISQISAIDIDIIPVSKDTDIKTNNLDNEDKSKIVLIESNTYTDIDNTIYKDIITPQPSFNHIDISNWISILIDKYDNWDNILKPYQNYIIYNNIYEFSDYSYNILNYISNTNYNINIIVYVYDILSYDIFTTLEANTYIKCHNEFYIEKNTEFLYFNHDKKIFEQFDFTLDSYSYEITVEFIVHSSIDILNIITNINKKISTKWFIKYTKGVFNELISTNTLEKLLTLSTMQEQ